MICLGIWCVQPSNFFFFYVGPLFARVDCGEEEGWEGNLDLLPP